MDCSDCVHFIHQHKGQRGASKGVCEQSVRDMYFWNESKITRRARETTICKRFIQKENENA